MGLGLKNHIDKVAPEHLEEELRVREPGVCQTEGPQRVNTACGPKWGPGTLLLDRGADDGAPLVVAKVIAANHTSNLRRISVPHAAASELSAKR